MSAREIQHSEPLLSVDEPVTASPEGPRQAYSGKRRNSGWRYNRLLYVQVALSCCTFFAEGFYATQLFPYAASMVEDLRGTAQAGLYAGLLYTVQSLGSMGSAYLWAERSNKSGRRICILTGLLSNTICSLLLAFSDHYALVVGLRFVSGFLNSNLAIVRTSMREVFQAEAEDDTRAFSALTVAFGAASVCGPSLGGLLYNTTFPCEDMEWCRSVNLHLRPWSMVHLVAVSFYVLSLLPTFLWFKETAFMLPSQVHSPVVGSPFRPRPSPRLTKDRNFWLLLIMGGGHSYVFTGWELVYPLFARLPRDLEGQAWTTAQIGLTFLCGSVGLVLYSLFGYPVLARRLSPVRLWMLSCSVSGLVLPIFPRALTLLCEWRAGVRLLQLLNYSTQLVVSVLLGSGFIGIQLILNEYVARRRKASGLLAVANSALASTQALVRAISPVVTGSLFVIGTSSEAYNIPLLTRALTFDVLCVVLFGCCVAAATVFHQNTR